MKLFILKTDLKSKRQVNELRPILERNDRIARWSVDLDDVDKVLKLETSIDSEQNEIINFVKAQGIYCEELSD